MKILFLGSGSAFTVGTDNFQSNMLIFSDTGKKFLLDCGSDVRHSLNEQGFNFQDIDAVYISHLHSDHVGGLEWLGFCSKFIANAKPQLFISADQADTLWNQVLVGGMRTLPEEVATLGSYFLVHRLGLHEPFHWEGIEFELVKTQHTFSNHVLLPSYGLMLKIKNNNSPYKIFITTDTQLVLADLQPYYQQADIIFQDCETVVKKTGVHAHFDELIALPDEIKSKMWLYDYNPGPLPNAQQFGFKGFVLKGQSFAYPTIRTYLKS